jgi:hypothetical protein
MLNVEDIIPYWNDVYDLLDEFDHMVVQRPDANPFTKKQVQAIWKLMVENMSEAGFPLGRLLYNRGRLLKVWIDKTSRPFGRKAYEQYKSVLDNAALESIFGKTSISAFERHTHKQKHWF